MYQWRPGTSPPHLLGSRLFNSFFTNVHVEYDISMCLHEGCLTQIASLVAASIGSDWICYTKLGSFQPVGVFDSFSQWFIEIDWC